MQVLIVIIEKVGGKYVGRSPNLIGVSITAKTRDEAETAILDAMEKRINELQGLHQNYKPIARGAVEESIGCVYKLDEDSWDCKNQAQKDGLCWQHWKKLYSHAFGTNINLKACPLCGETDRELLKRWDSPCPFKAQHPNWEQIFEEKKIKMRGELEKEKEQVKLEKLGNNLQCSKILSNGKQCLSAAKYGDLCWKHYWRSRHTTPNYQQNYRSDSQTENARNYFKYGSLRK